MPSTEPERSSFPQPPERHAIPSPERRRVPRAKPSGLTYVKIEPDNGGTLLDVCESGLRFQVIAPVEESARIQLWFVLDAANHIEVSGELAWIDETRRTGGLKFTHSSKQARRQIRAWLAQHPPETAKVETISLAPQAEPSADEGAIAANDFEGQLQNLHHADPAPLESLLDGILASLNRPHAEDIFAAPLASLDGLQAPSAPIESSAAASAEAERVGEESSQPASLSAAASAPPVARAKPARPATPRRVPPRSVPADNVASRPSSPSAIPPDVLADVVVPPRGTPARVEPERPLSRAALPASLAAPKPDPETEIKFLQFRLAVNRVSGMLSTLRDAVESDDSEWPLTAPPEYHPIAAEPAPEEVLAAAPQPRATQDAPEIESIAEPEPPAELDARPWSAGAPWRAVESPAASSSWRETIAKSTREYISAARQVIAPQFARAKSAAAAFWIALKDGTRFVAAQISSAGTGASRAAKFGASLAAAKTTRAAKSGASAIAAANSRPAKIPARAAAPAKSIPARTATPTRAPIPAPTAIPPSPANIAPAASSAFALRAALIQAASTAASPAATRTAVPARPPASKKTTEILEGAKGKLTTATNVAKRATSSVLSSFVPAEPTPAEMRTLLVVTAVLIAALLAFSYRDKLTSHSASFASTGFTEITRPAAVPDSNPAAAPAANPAAPAPKPAVHHVSQTPPRATGARTEPEIITRRSSTPEFETALAYLGDSSSSYDPATAAKWLWAATRKGDTAANILLADLYIRGDGVPQNCAQGRILLLAASQKGNEEATRKLQQVDAGACGNPGQ